MRNRDKRPFLDRIRLAQSGSHRVHFEILEQWNATALKTAIVTTRLTGEACGFPFEIGKEYLVYAVTEPKDIQIGICTVLADILADSECLWIIFTNHSYGPDTA